MRRALRLTAASRKSIAAQGVSRCLRRLSRWISHGAAAAASHQNAGRLSKPKARREAICIVEYDVGLGMEQPPLYHLATDGPFCSFGGRMLSHNRPHANARGPTANDSCGVRQWWCGRWRSGRRVPSRCRSKRSAWPRHRAADETEAHLASRRDHGPLIDRLSVDCKSGKPSRGFREPSRLRMLAAAYAQSRM